MYNNILSVIDEALGHSKMMQEFYKEKLTDAEKRVDELEKECATMRDSLNSYVTRFGAIGRKIEIMPFEDEAND